MRRDGEAGAATLRLATADDLAAARTCYARNDFTGTVRREDRVLLAEAAGGAVVGVARLAEERGHLVLRGLILDPPVRGRGLGGRMVADLMEAAGERACWLICGPHLIRFYGRAGFRLVADEEAPPHLRARVGDYRDRFGPQCLLRRPPAR